ncbi:hypothetical protein K1719_032307 [Acacia pycnantha]|nr:hypothetical protein K1719_032307 [Acacia pycnantha]
MRDPIHNLFQSFTSLAPPLQISSHLRFSRPIFWAIHWASQNFLLLSRNFSLLDSLRCACCVIFSSGTEIPHCCQQVVVKENFAGLGVSVFGCGS